VFFPETNSCFSSPTNFANMNMAITRSPWTWLGLILTCLLVYGESAAFSRVCSLNSKQYVVQFDASTNEFSLLSNVTVDNAQVSQGQYVALSCPCREDTYCLVNSGNACGTHRSSDAVSCFSLDSRTIFVRNAWPVVVLWYGGKSCNCLNKQNISINCISFINWINKTILSP